MIGRSVLGSRSVAGGAKGKRALGVGGEQNEIDDGAPKTQGVLY